jgi:ATP-dependent RNA helicase RhlB
MELAYEHMNEPELVQIEPDKVTADRVRQAIFFPSNEDKMPLLIGLVREMGAARIMIFVNMKRDAERVQDHLEANGINARAISGDVPQKKRLRMLMDFQSGDLQVLIGTDVASRGLHSIGRTARAGAAGDAISFGCETYVMSLPEIEDYIGHKLPVANYTPEDLPEIVRPKPRPRKPRGGSPRRRPGGKEHNKHPKGKRRGSRTPQKD